MANLAARLGKALTLGGEAVYSIGLEEKRAELQAKRDAALAQLRKEEYAMGRADELADRAHTEGREDANTAYQRQRDEEADARERDAYKFNKRVRQEELASIQDERETRRKKQEIARLYYEAEGDPAKQAGLIGRWMALDGALPPGDTDPTMRAMRWLQENLPKGDPLLNDPRALAEAVGLITSPNANNMGSSETQQVAMLRQLEKNGKKVFQNDGEALEYLYKNLKNPQDGEYLLGKAVTMLTSKMSGLAPGDLAKLDAQAELDKYIGILKKAQKDLLPQEPIPAPEGADGNAAPEPGSIAQRGWTVKEGQKIDPLNDVPVLTTMEQVLASQDEKGRPTKEFIIYAPNPTDPLHRWHGLGYKMDPATRTLVKIVTPKR